MKGFWIALVIGLGAGIVLAAFLGPRMMLQERPSLHGLEETVKRLSQAAIEGGWVVSSVMPLDESIVKNGGERVRPVRLVNICQPHHASTILREDGARIVSVLMPCTIAVYEKGDGKVYVSAMNPAVLAPLFGGVIGRVMGGPVAREQARFIDAVTK